MELRQCIGEEASFSKTFTEFDVGCFSAFSGDFDPLHVNEEYARQSRFGQRIAHGLAVMGLLSSVESTVSERLVARGIDGKPFSLGYDRVRFIKPVFVGDTLTARYRIVDVDETRRRLFGECRVLRSPDESVLVGQHVMVVG